MLQTSVLERLSGPLVDHVCRATDGARWLVELAAVNQLVIGLDPTGTWFRYHHLLSDLLRLEAQRSIAADLPGLHTRAAEWLAEHGEATDAIEHALAGGDLGRAADLVAAHGTALLNAGRFATLVRYLDALGSTGHDHAGCAALAGWLHLSQGHWVEALEALERTRALGAVDGAHPAAAALAITFELTAGNVAAALAVAREVRAAGRDTETAQIAMMVGAAFTLAGLPDEAAAPLAAADELAKREPDHYAAVVVPVYQAMGALEVDDRERARERAARSLSLADEFGNAHAPLACFAHSLLGRAGPDGSAALDQVRRGAELARRSPDNLFLAYAEVCAGDVLCAAGDPEGPTHLAAARAIVESSVDPGLVGAYLDRVESRHRLAVAPVQPEALVEELTDRELALLRFLPTELSQREIAAELYVSVNTVKTHARGLYRKLGVGGRKPAVHRARELGLL
jgi:LuxR family maltose regulon positive regulatory protein